MTSTSRRAALGLVLFSMGFAALAGWSCGETGDTDPTPVATFKITPSANSTSTSASPSPAPSAAPTDEPRGTPGASTVLEVAGVNSQFDVEDLTAPAGSITVEFDNRDSGIVHNIHFYRGSDDQGESVAETELESGPIEQTVTFDVEPGEYYYVCDAHPTTMEGTLTVE